MTRWPNARRGVRCLAYSLLVLLTAARVAAAATGGGVDKLTYHGDAARSGWNDRERRLTPAIVAGKSFGPLWNSPAFDAVDGVPARLFASPLYVHRVRLRAPAPRSAPRAVVYAAATTGYVYAVNATGSAQLPPGAILWRARLTGQPCGRATLGILGTPVIDPARHRLYVAACDQHSAWSVHALDLRSGSAVPGWPVALTPAAINAPGINANGPNRWPGGVAGLQRGALNLSPDRARLYVTFGGEPVPGWLLALDTRSARVVAAFSATRSAEEGVGGMWASGGAAVDAAGAVYVATGSSVVNALAGKGIAGVYPESEGNWGQSIVKLRSLPDGALQLAGTYTPFDYCEAGSRDLDLGSGSPVLFDLARGESATRRLLVLGGSKQGNAYLLDRERFPGSLVRRQPCATVASLDGSLLAPEAQPQFGTRGPLNVFGPYSTAFGMGDLAKSRSTAAYFRDAAGRRFVIATGSAKAAENSRESVAPGLARLRVVTARDAAPFLRVDGVASDIVFQNPGSPVISSFHSRDAIVWVLDANQPRSASLYGAAAASAVLYAVDPQSLRVLWRSEPRALRTSGKYNEPAVVDGMVIVGTDRIQAFGVPAPGSPAPEEPADGPDASAMAAPANVGTTPVAPAASAALYQQRCAPCHDVPREGVPLRLQIAGLAPAAVVEKLKFGSMQVQALGLDDGQIEGLAQWLTARP